MGEIEYPHDGLNVPLSIPKNPWDSLCSRNTNDIVYQAGVSPNSGRLPDILPSSRRLLSYPTIFVSVRGGAFYCFLPYILYFLGSSLAFLISSTSSFVGWLNISSFHFFPSSVEKNLPQAFEAISISFLSIIKSFPLYFFCPARAPIFTNAAFVLVCPSCPSCIHYTSERVAVRPFFFRKGCGQ